MVVIPRDIFEEADAQIIICLSHDLSCFGITFTRSDILWNSIKFAQNGYHSPSKTKVLSCPI